MSIARADCICKTCGKHFERSTTKRNSTEARNWKKWAESAIDECVECMNERLLQEAEIAEHEFGMCELKGTEKQIPWARRIRVENYTHYVVQKQQGKWNEAQIKTLDEMFKQENRSWFWIEERDTSMRTRGSRYWKDKKDREEQQ